MFKDKFKATIVAILTVVMSVGTVSVVPAMAAANYADTELARAVNLGFGTYRTDNPTITYAQFMTMLDKAIELTNKSKLTTWQTKYADARKSKKTINRGNAIIGVFAAAEMLGGEVYSRNCEDRGEGNYSGEWNAEKFWGNVSRIPVGFENITKDSSTGSGNFRDWAGHYVTSRASVITGMTIFEYKDGKKYIAANENLKYQEALKAALRLYESSITITERYPTEADKRILAKAEARKKAILNSTTAVTVEGTKYYVSNKGNDNNDGRTPQTAWTTLSKVNSAELKPGDGVFFERGGLWRGYIDCAKGVTYSAYGTGEKPKIYGSLESGTDAAKWKLWYDKNGVKIWKFYRDITEVGNIVFDGGASYASRVYAYYNGANWVISGKDQRPFDIAQGLKQDLQFYSTFELSQAQYEEYAKRDGGVVYTEGIDTSGQLYLRCDKGNPGELYREIEFHNAPAGLYGYEGLVNPNGNNTIDNLSIKYGLCNGIAIYGEGNLNLANDNNLIQNCEIAWTGGVEHDLKRREGDVMVCGEGIVFKTDNNIFRNNYIYQNAAAGIVSEFVGNEYVPDNTMSKNTVIEGNLFERSQDTLWFWDNGYKGGDIIFWDNTKITDNYVMYMGYGWSSDPKFMSPVNTYHKAGETWAFAIGGTSAGIKNMVVKDNVFYLSNGGYLVHVPDMYERLCDVTFSGNTYVQNDNRKILSNEMSKNSLTVGAIQLDIERFLGDKKAVVLPPSVPLARQSK